MKSIEYTKPFSVKRTTSLKAVAIIPGREPSFTITAEFIRISRARKIILNTRYAGQYSAGGDLALIDFIRGGENFKTGTWQGYEGVNVNAVIDLGSVQTIRKLSIGCLQDQGAWIFMPVEAEFSISTDGKQYSNLPPVKNTVDEKEEGPVIKEFSVEVKRKSARYIKVKAINRGKCPDWHPGSGKKAWIFVDEIVIN